eukprot:12261361-Prorocentrum_lima.AAC.1
MTSSLVGSEMCIRDRSTWLKVKHVIAKYRAAGLEAIFDSSLKQAVMTDQSEPFAMWVSGAFYFLLPLDQLPKAATDTRNSICLLYTSDAADDM